MRAYERLLKYVTVRTPSDETSTTVPSSACQFDLAQDLIREFINLGLPKARRKKQMVFELQFLDWLQTLQTPILNEIMKYNLFNPFSNSK